MRLFLLALLLACTGCAEFVQQTLLVRYDKAADTIHLRLVYHGIYADGSKKKEIDEALAQLKKVVDRGTRFYIFDNWPLGADVGPPDEGERDSPGNALIRPYTTVKNGKFCLDGNGRLCAWQDIHFKNVSKLQTQTNQALALALIANKVDLYKDADAETRKRVARAMAKKIPLVRCDARGLALHLPLSPDDAARAKRAFLDEMVKDVEKRLKKAEKANAEGNAPPAGDVDSVEAMLRVLARNRFELLHDESGLTLRLPADANGVVRLDWWNKGTYVPNLLEARAQDEPAPKLPLPIDPQLTPEALIQAFTKPPPVAK